MDYFVIKLSVLESPLYSPQKQKTKHFLFLAEREGFALDFCSTFRFSTKVNTIITQMHLTIAETETLNHYMAGLGFVEIAQMQNVSNTTVWRRRKSIQKKYLRYVVMQG